MLESFAESILSQQWGWENVRRDAFQLLAWGYADAEATIRQEDLEVNITGMLAGAMDNRLSFAQIPPRFILYNVKEEAHVNTSGKLGNQRPRIDIVVEHTGNRPAKKYVFEAKRCAKRYKGGIKWYVKGVENFLTLDYARNAPEASIVGLIQSDTSVYWRAQLSTQTAKDVALCCEVHPASINVIADLPDMVVSTHRRNDTSLIDLYHVFLDCKKPGT